MRWAARCQAVLNAVAQDRYVPGGRGCRWRWSGSAGRRAPRRRSASSAASFFASQRYGSTRRTISRAPGGQAVRSRRPVSSAGWTNATPRPRRPGPAPFGSAAAWARVSPARSATFRSSTTPTWPDQILVHRPAPRAAGPSPWSSPVGRLFRTVHLIWKIQITAGERHPSAVGAADHGLG